MWRLGYRSMWLCGKSFIESDKTSLVKYIVFQETPATTEVPCTKVCDRGYYLHPQMCECHLTCDYIMKCEEGSHWDTIECGCVVRVS